MTATECARMNAVVSPSPLSARSFFRDPVGFARRHGRDGAELDVAAGPSRFVVVRDPQEVWRILVTDADAFRPGKWKRRARRFVGSEGDLLTALRGSGLPERTVRGEVIAFLLAAVDEPPSALEAAWYLLERSPRARERLEAELDEGGRDYLDAVLRETLRLFPPARHIDRCPVRDGRTNVVLSLLVMHHHPP